MVLLIMETKTAAETNASRKMYLTAAEAEAINLPSNEEQIRRWNETQRALRADLHEDSCSDGIDLDLVAEYLLDGGQAY